jgi:hypothetical protein
MDQKITLTKSTFLRGLQCQKSLALSARHPELRMPPTTPAQFRMRQGQLVGMLARRRYPGGEIGRLPGAFQVSLERTQALIDSGNPVIYEAAFEAAGVRVVADILAQGQNGWRLIEVKSTTRAKPEHLWDVAVQVYVLRAAGMELEDACLLHLDTGYVRKGLLDVQALFAETPFMGELETLQTQVEQAIAECQATLASGEVPQVPIGRHCTEPVDCDFMDHCWQDVPSPSVFDVYFIGKKAYALYDQGIELIEDIPADHPLDKRSLFHIQAHKKGELIVKPDPIRTFLSGLSYPLHYLDFETLAVPIPPFDGVSPYTKVPFQYSLHVQDEPGGELRHSGYLAQAGEDPRRDFLGQLLEETSGEGSIVVYHQPFESSVLKSLASWLPANRGEIEQRLKRMADLLEPFRQRAYWHPGMGGSNSLKAVLPVFAQDLSYDEIAISDGESAMVEFWGLQDEDDLDRVQATRRALWEYCQLDTLAMVRILDGLRGLVGM